MYIMYILNKILSIMITLFVITIFKLTASYACTVQKVREAHFLLPRSVVFLSQLNEQKLSANQLCLLEALFLRGVNDNDIFQDLYPWRIFDDIISSSVDDIQFRIIHSVIETADLSNDISETRLIGSILYKRWLARPYNGGRFVGRRAFSFSPEKADFIDFALQRATDDNHYRDADIIYQVLEEENIDEQDIRNVKLALLTAGRDFTYEDSSSSFGRQAFFRYGRFGRSSVVRAMIDPRASRQKKDLMGLVVALEHPENAITEARLLRRIANTRYGSFSPEEYQCIVNALHAYLAPGRDRKPDFITNRLGYIMTSDGRCLINSYFNRSYFTHYDINTVLDEYLAILENEEEINIPYQCVGSFCL